MNIAYEFVMSLYDQGAVLTAVFINIKKYVKACDIVPVYIFYNFYKSPCFYSQN